MTEPKRLSTSDMLAPRRLSVGEMTAPNRLSLEDMMPAPERSIVERAQSFADRLGGALPGPPMLPGMARLQVGRDLVEGNRRGVERVRQTPEIFDAPIGRAPAAIQLTEPPVPSPMAQAAGRGVARGARQGAMSAVAAGAAFADLPVEASAARIAEQQRRLRENPQPENVQRFFRSSGMDALRAFMAAPGEITGTILAESVGTFAPALGAAGVGALAGGPLGAAAAAGGTSGAMEAGSAILESMAEAGVDLTDEQSIVEAFRNPTLMSEARKRGALKGIPIGLFDAVSIGLAGRLFGPASRAVGGPVAGPAAGAAAEVGAQAGLGAGGEALGQALSEGELRGPEIAAEAIGELALGPVEAAISTASRGRPAVSEDVGGPLDLGAEGGLVTPQEPDAEAGPLDLGAEGGLVAPPALAQQQTQVFTPRGRPVDVRYDVVEADNLITSHDDDLAVNPGFPQELQPRERGRAASQTQIAEIAGNLRPEMLGPTVNAAEGAPIVGDDGVVESGNARTIAIRRAYGQGMPSAESYRNWLAEQGYPVEGMRAPVLVGRRLTAMSPDERAGFAREANERSTLDLSPSERAVADADGMPTDILDLYRGGRVGDAANRDFVRQFLNAVAPTERASLVTDQGALSQQGQQRIENAIFAKAYGVPDLLAVLRESRDGNVTAIGNAMIDAAPAWASMRQRVDLGMTPENMDQTASLNRAVDVVRLSRDKRIPVADIVAQADAFNPMSSDTVSMLNLMFTDDTFRRPVSAKKLSDALNYYAGEAVKVETTAGLFGELPPVTPAMIIDSALQRQRGGLLPGPRDTQDILTESMIANMAASPPRQPGPSQTPPAQLTFAQMTGQDPIVPVKIDPGARHVGHRPEAAATGQQDIGKPIRREDVLRPFLKAVNATVFEGRMRRMRTVAGFFVPRTEAIRVKTFSNLETTAHEVAHLLDWRDPEIRKQWLPATKGNKAIREELRAVSYDKSKLFEGFAEFVRLWMTQPEKAQQAAPKFSDWWEGYVERSPMGPAIRQARADMLAWFEQDALSRAASKIGEVASINSGMSQPFMRWRAGIFDDLEGIRNMEQSVSGEMAPVGAYVTSRLTRGKMAFIEGALTIGAPVVNKDGSHSFKGKSLTKLLEPVSNDLDRFWLYAVGRSARELKGQRRENLFSEQEIVAMEALETPERRKAFDDYQVWNSAILDFAEAKGIINPAKRATWQRKQYIPFYRVSMPTNIKGPSAPSAGGPVEGQFTGIKRLTGGTANIQSIGHNVIQNASMLISASIENEARQKVAQLAGRKGGGLFMMQIPTEDKRIQVIQDGVRAGIRERMEEASFDRRAERINAGEDADAVNAEENAALDAMIEDLDAIMASFTGLVPVLQTGLAPGGKNVMAVMFNGEPRYFEIADPLLWRALSALSRPMQNDLVRILSLPKRLGQASVTLTPDFIVRNFFRDQLMAGIFSKHGFRPFVDGARGLVSRATNDQDYKDFIANGGGFSSYLVDEKAFRKNLERFYGRKGIGYRTVMDSPTKLLMGLERVADSFEMASRLGEFKRARARGAPARQAAFEGREVSTDFAMRGDYQALGMLYDTVIFLKAGMNGLDRVYRGFTKDTNKRSIAIKTGMLGLFSALLYALNRDNPLYDELEDWDRDVHWHVFVPTEGYYDFMRANGREPQTPEESEGAYTHLRLPKIWEIGAIASITERALQAIMDEQPEPLARQTAQIIKDLFMIDFVPQALEPLYELAINRNRFTGAPIISQGMEDLAPFLQARPSTSVALQTAATAVRNVPGLNALSPAEVEHLLRGYFNTWAAYGLTIADGMLVDDAPDLRIDEYPVLKSFVREQPLKRTRHTTQFWDALREATIARRSMRALDKAERPEIADEFAETRENLNFDQLSQAKKTMTAISGEIGFVLESNSLEELQQFTQDRAAQEGRAQWLRRLRESGDWNNIGALKRRLHDDLISERNRHAREVMRDIGSLDRDPRQLVP